MTRFKGAIFDLDGTILDSMGVWSDIDIKFLGKRGLEVPDNYVKMITPLSFRQTAEYTIERFGFSDTPEELMDEWAVMANNAYKYYINAKPYAVEYLKKLKKNGLKLAIASASEKENYFPALRRLKIFDLFDAFTSLSETARDKSFPDIYLKTAESLGLSPNECVVFEDTLQTVKSAKSGGFYTVGVFDKSSADKKEEIKDIADDYIENFREEVIICQ